MDSSRPKRLVGVDVAHTGNRPLTEQERLDRSVGAGQLGAETPGVERIGKWFGPEVGQSRNRLVATSVHHYYPAEATYILEDQPAPVVERETCTRIRIDYIKTEYPRHSQVHHQLEATIQRRYQKLAAPADTGDLPSPQLPDPLELAGDHRVGIHPHVEDPASTQLRVELAAHGLDFWKLRHVR